MKDWPRARAAVSCSLGRRDSDADTLAIADGGVASRRRLGAVAGPQQGLAVIPTAASSSCANAEALARGQAGPIASSCRRNFSAGSTKAFAEPT